MRKPGLIAFNHGIQTVLGEGHSTFDQMDIIYIQNQWKSTD